MAQIIPHIHKRRLPRDLQYPLRYSELEHCFTGRCAEDAYLDLFFSEWRDFIDTPRELRSREGLHHLLDARFDPERTGWEGSRLTYPWSAAERPLVVRLHVYAAPAAAMSDTGCRVEVVADAFRRVLERIACGDLLGHRWECRIDLNIDRRALECFSTHWTGLRPEPEVVTRVPLPGRDAGTTGGRT